MIVTVGHIKGGIGKSTLACNLAVFLSKLDGRENTCVIDADRQQSATKFKNARATLEKAGRIRTGLFDCVSAHGTGFMKILDQVSNKYQHIVVDVGGQDNEAMRAALLRSELLLCPNAPRTFELWSMEELEDVVELALKFNPVLKPYTFLNMAYAQGPENKQVIDYLKAEFPTFRVLPSKIVQRRAWSNSSGFGYEITDKKYRDNKAVAEFWQVLSGIGFSKQEITRGLG